MAICFSYPFPVCEDGAVQVPHEVGWHAVQPFVVIPRCHGGAERYPEDKPQSTRYPSTGEPGSATGVEVQDCPDSVEDLPQWLEARDESEEARQRVERHGPPDVASAR